MSATFAPSVSDPARQFGGAYGGVAQPGAGPPPAVTLTSGSLGTGGGFGLQGGSSALYGNIVFWIGAGFAGPFLLDLTYTATPPTLALSAGWATLSVSVTGDVVQFAATPTADVVQGGVYALHYEATPLD